MSTVVIIQARMGSTRLPGKILMPLAGRPMLFQVIARARRIPGVDAVVVATTELAQDDVLVPALAGICQVVRGPADDVLRRYRIALDAYPADIVIRITADCPLLCPDVSGQVLARFLHGDCDYASNTLVRSYPRGLDTEVFAAALLRRAEAEARDPAEREHVTPFMYRDPTRFRLASCVAPVDRSLWRWTVDTVEDFALMTRLYAELSASGFEGNYSETAAIMAAHPDWGALNAEVVQKPTFTR